MSAAPPGWWQASDGNWYPPDPPAPPFPAPGPASGVPVEAAPAAWVVPQHPGAYGAPPWPQHGYPPSPYAVPPGYPPYGAVAGWPDPYAGVPGSRSMAGPTVARPLNRLAAWAAICSLIGLLAAGVPAAAGVVMGIVALGQIKRYQGRQRGRGWAIAAIVIGLIGCVIWLNVLASALSHGS